MHILSPEDCTFEHMCPVKILIRLRSLIRIFTGNFWIAKDAKFLHADNEDSVQTARMYRLNCDVIGQTCLKLLYIFSCCRSYHSCSRLNLLQNTPGTVYTPSIGTPYLLIIHVLVLKFKIFHSTTCCIV